MGVVVSVAAVVLVGGLLLFNVIRERRRKSTQPEETVRAQDSFRAFLKNSTFMVKAIAAFIPFIVASIVLSVSGFASGILGPIAFMIPAFLFVGAIVYIKLLANELRSQRELEEEMKTWDSDDHK